MECSITDGPASTDDALEESRHTPEPEYDKYYDRDYTLVDELKSITLLQTQISRIESLVESMENTTYGRRQA